LVCRLKKEIINRNANRAKDIFLWQQLQHKQKCKSLKNLQYGTETDVACVGDHVAFTEILDFAGYVCAN
jgi:hypothetical protein